MSNIYKRSKYPLSDHVSTVSVTINDLLFLTKYSVTFLEPLNLSSNILILINHILPLVIDNLIILFVIESTNSTTICLNLSQSN